MSGPERVARRRALRRRRRAVEPPHDRTRAGASLAEVLVGVVVLEVGLLATAGMIATAAATLAEAERVSAAASFAREVADSLALATERSAGSVRRDRLEAEWEEVGGGAFRIRVRSRSTGEVVLRLLVRPPGAGRGVV